MRRSQLKNAFIDHGRFPKTLPNLPKRSTQGDSKKNHYNHHHTRMYTRSSLSNLFQKTCRRARIFNLCLFLVKRSLSLYLLPTTSAVIGGKFCLLPFEPEMDYDVSPARFFLHEYCSSTCVWRRPGSQLGSLAGRERERKREEKRSFLH